MRSSDQANTIGKQFHSMSIPQTHLGIVSPCSTCLNQRSVQSSDGRPSCPRRAAAAMKQELDEQTLDSSYYNLLVLTGSAPGQQDDGTKPLTNPVYDSPSNSILVWAATFKDNGPTIGSDGTVLSPNILDPKFSSDWLKCWASPFAPRDSEAQYFQKGCLMEGDQVEIVVGPKQQVTAQQSGLSQAIPIDGTVTKINANGQYPRQPVQKDLCVSGT